MIDYDAISKKNERELGTKLKSRRTQISLYADPTHFVYELLQNADDHGATEISFTLLLDRLIVEHNATERFATKHIEAISSFEDSTSEEELLKTGKFGLGFKSVFAFTATPRVYCGDANFEIYDLYRLRGLVKPEDLSKTLTRFELPFNHMELQPEFIFREHMKTPQTAIEIIHEKFESLEDITLLFTRNLATIRVTAADARYSWKRKVNRDGTITIKTRNATANFRLRATPIKWQGIEHRPVQIAIRLDEKGTPVPSDEHLVVTFPTSISTGMGIILNGPYRTTPARETVGEGDDFNRFLVEQSAELLAEMIREERNEKRLTLEFLEILPIQGSRANSKDFFSPIHSRIRKLIVDEPILPTAKGKYVAGKYARIARGQYLTDLISDNQLTMIYESDCLLHWLSKDVTETNTPNLYGALAGSGRNIYHRVSDGLVNGIVIRPEFLFAKLSAKFLNDQPASWMCKLYAALHKQASSEAKAAAAIRPIVRLSTQKHVPVLTNGRPSAYLPQNTSTKYETIEPKVLKSPDARAYFTSCGYRPPDLSAEVFERVLPRYRNGDPGVAFNTHLLHLSKILKVSKDLKVAAQLFQQLRPISIVLCFNASTNEEQYCRAGDVYVWDTGLASYFAGNPDAWFISQEYSSASDGNSFLELFQKLGAVAKVPRELCDSGPYAQHSHGQHERGIAGFHPEWDLDGLDYATANPTIEGSAFIWNYLLPRFENRICGKVQSSSRQDFPARHTTEYFKVSPGGEILRERTWIPDTSGMFRTGKAIGTLDSLHASLEKDQDLLAILDEGASLRKTQAAQALDISLEEAEFIRENREEFKQFQHTLMQRQAHQVFLDDSPSGNRERRRSKLQKRIPDAPSKGDKEHGLRSRPTYSRSEIDRQALFNMYTDEDEGVVICQICVDPMPFSRRNANAHCGKCLTLFSKRWAEDLISQGELGSHEYGVLNRTWADEQDQLLKVITPLNLVLCPTCFDLYREYVHLDPSRQTQLLRHLREGVKDHFVICDANIRRDNKETKLTFNNKHLADICDCLRRCDGDEA